jgi:hypothetical protein
MFNPEQLYDWEAMRHRSIASTCVYARTDDGAVRAAVGG